MRRAHSTETSEGTLAVTSDPYTSGDFETYLADEGARVRSALDRALAALRARVAHGVGADVLDAAEYGVRGGGKLLRPILCVTAYRACAQTTPDSVYDLAASLELIHAYSLMHDDLPCMDDAELRRGRPATHIAYGEEATVLGGAMLIPAAALQAWEACGALGCSEGRRREVVRRLMVAAGAGGMVGGQWIDLESEGETLTSDELDALHRLKTGALLTASLTMGAQAAGARHLVIDALERYGRAIGLAFQIADDVLDATSTADALGKRPSDAELQKSTYVSLHGLEEARVRARTLVVEAQDALAEAAIDAPRLVELAEYVVRRSH